MKATDKNMMTQGIHGSEIKDGLGSPSMPLYDTTTFCFNSTADLVEVIEGEKDNAYLYSRYGLNPSIKALESKLARLDGAQKSLAFCSGMAAISALCIAYGGQGIICIGDVYGGTMQLLSEQLPNLGITTYFIDSDDNDQLHTLLKTKAALVFLETPANPTLKLIDIEKLANIAHQYGALVAVDNTFCSPVNQKPLALGADFAVQSATKFLGGHSDLTAGVLSASAKHLTLVDSWRKNLGQAIAPEIAHKLSRSLSTLALRIERHNENALIIAEFLNAKPQVKQVYYPGLETVADHSIALKQMSGFGGMLSFECYGSVDDAVSFVDSLQLFTLAPSLGGVESLVSQPVLTSHHDMSEDELLRRGISGQLIRLSIGLEDVADLIADLEQALAAIVKKS